MQELLYRPVSPAMVAAIVGAQLVLLAMMICYRAGLPQMGRAEPPSVTIQLEMPSRPAPLGRTTAL